MAKYKITDPASGKSFIVTGDSPPTEEEANQIFGSTAPPHGLADTAIDMARSVPGGLAQGAAAAAGVGGDMRESLARGAKAIGGDTAGDVTNKVLGVLPVLNSPSSSDINGVLSAPTGGYYKPQTNAGQFAETAASFAPAAFGGEGSIASRLLGRVLAPAAGSVGGGKIASALGAPAAAGQIPGALIGAVLGNHSPQAIASLLAKSPAVPTVDALKAAARKAYAAVDNSGMVIKKDAVAQMASDLDAKLAKLGIDQTLHPDAMSALGRIHQAAGNNQTLQGLDVLRRVAADAAMSTKPADKMMARVIRDHIDDFAGNLSANDVMGPVDQNALDALSSARNLWSRAAKGEQIGRLIDKAGLQATQFSGSGYENALRTQFRRLAMNDRGIARFTPDEQAAIRRVAEGGPIGNALRLLGKLAPHGVVSAALGGGIGFAAGGPAGAVALPLAGELGRLGATAVTSRNARLASELMRSGSAPNVATTASAMPSFSPKALAALLTQPYIASTQGGR